MQHGQDTHRRMYVRRYGKTHDRDRNETTPHELARGGQKKRFQVFVRSTQWFSIEECFLPFALLSIGTNIL